MKKPRLALLVALVCALALSVAACDDGAGGGAGATGATSGGSAGTESSGPLSTWTDLALTGDVPASGAVVTAGYEFDVPVRFDTDRLEISLSGFQHGAIPNIPVVEVRR